MDRITVNISGMHCRSCELLIEGKLKKIPEVKKAIVNYKKRNAEIYLTKPIDIHRINEAIEDAGYTVGQEQKRAWFSSESREYRELVTPFILLILIYFLIKQAGFNGFNTGSVGNPSNLAVVLLIGLTAGFSTCMALVGGLILGISARHAEIHPEANSFQKFRPHLFFNLGRIASYILLGGIIGLVGKAFQLSGPSLGFLTIAVGLVMLLVGLQLTGIFPRLAHLSFTLPSGISKRLGFRKHHEKEYSHLNSSLVGALTFFLPCGFTQAMQLYAMTTGSFTQGALIMGAFALGTAPGLLGVGGLTSVIKGTFARKFFKFVSLVVISLAIFNISNGLNLSGLTTKLSLINFGETKAQFTETVPIENGVQVVRMDQIVNGYRPNKFTVRKGVPVKWIINSQDPGSCAASLYSSELNVRKFLKRGENVIEFTPNKIGKIGFSCSMGMYRGQFEVIENNSDTAPTIQNQNNQPAANSDQLDKKEDSKITAETQIIKAVYTYQNDIQPNQFTVKAGKPVRFEIEAKDDGQGCMASVAIPELASDFDYLQKGKTTIFNFTAQKPGNYFITCAMGSIRGIIKAE